MDGKMKKTNCEQFKKLVELMEENPDIAKGLGNFGSTKRTSQEFWGNAAVNLNSIGPPTRDGKQWHKVWLDYKLKLKKRIAGNKKVITGTGGGPYSPLSLSPLEQAVDSLLGLQHAVNPSGMSFGANESSVGNEEVALVLNESGVEDAIVIEDTLQTGEVATTHATDTTLQSGSRRLSPPFRNRNSRQQGEADRREKERIDLLNQQTATQEEMLSTIKSIDKNLAELARYNRKLYDLKKRENSFTKGKRKEERKRKL